MANIWNSLLVEILRFGGEAGILRKDDPYLVVRANEPVAKYEMELDHEEFLTYLDRLRYASGTSVQDRDATRAKLGAIATHILRLAEPNADVQIDLVLNAKELCAFPFEAASDADGMPLLVRDRPCIEITRRVRGSFRDRAPGWPAKPRVLFAAASPVQSVPADAHRQALRTALAPWIAPLDGFPGAVPDERSVLTFLDQASLEGIRDACLRQKDGFTHVHLLAHGREVGRGMRQQYGLELHADASSGGVAVPADALVEALRSGESLPSVVTVMACDSANVGSTVVASAGLAHALHASGVPVVLGSQYPLTVAGSTVAVERFYGALLAGADVRDALHHARFQLYQERAETAHDWMSLVAYVQLPEGYADRLVDVRLEAELATLKNVQQWADYLSGQATARPDQYESVASRLGGCIASLLKWVEQPENIQRRDALVENRGLLGSAHKRLAELLFCRAKLDAELGRWENESRAALQKAWSWYERAFRENLSSHWVGVQQLSLEAVLHGKIERPWQWHTAIEASRTACADVKEFWACGSLAELHLLAPYAGEQKQLAEAVEALLDLRARVREPFPLESTARQLDRYAWWWTASNGFFPGAPDLAVDVKKVIEEAGLPAAR
ncbi:MAG: hypothetical protein H6Q30_1152 [Bacteroidetes bacterium]|nr:hypothetical protein [Bacteroidota bacterium]